MRDGVVMATVYASNYFEDRGWEWANLQPSVTTVLWCDKGSLLYVKSSDWGGSAARTTDGYFTVALLQKKY